MDIFSLLIGFSIVGGTYITTGAVTGRVILSKLLSENKFHLLRRKGEFVVVAGPRREVMKLSEVPLYEAELKWFSRSAIIRWPRLLMSLYAPRQIRAKGISQRLRSRALDGQRNAIGVKLMDRNLDYHPLMTKAYLAETDEEFVMLHKAIESFDRTGSFNLKDSSPQRNFRENPDQVVLLSNHQRSKGISSGIPRELSRGLPSGYRWRYSLRTDSLYEKLYVALVEVSTDRVLFEEGFYTHIWNSKLDRRSQTLKIKKRLVIFLDAKINPEGHKNRVLRDVS